MTLPTDPDRFGTVGRGTDDEEVRLRFQQGTKTGAYDLLVVDDDDPYPLLGVHVSTLDAGSVASTRKPPTDAVAIRSVPPTIVTRSCIPGSPCPLTRASPWGPGPLSRTRTRRVSLA